MVAPPSSTPRAQAQGIDAARRLHVPLAYLRAFVIALVVVHHVATGYHGFVPQIPASSLAEHYTSFRAISPVNDAQRSGLLTLFTGFNDSFMMPLLFLVAGLFTWGSLRRKGPASYLRGRLVRLGLPLLAMIALRPLSHYPTYLQIGGTGGPAGFWEAWSALPWRGGPLWFLALLLAFDVLVTLAAGLKLDPSRWLERLPLDLPQRPLRAYLLFLLLAALAYVPVTVAYGSFLWRQVGPSQLELDRLPLYLVYFLAGLALGAHGIERSFLAQDDPRLSGRWARWTLAALLAYALGVGAAIAQVGAALVGFLTVLAGATISMAFLALFLRFARRRRPLLDSLYANSYGIYVIHYGIVAWLLYAALGLGWPAMAKWALLSPLALAICWAIVAALRRVPAIARVI